MEYIMIGLLVIIIILLLFHFLKTLMNQILLSG